MEDLLIMKELTGSVVVTLEAACYSDLKKKMQGAIYSSVHKGSLGELRISWPACI